MKIENETRFSRRLEDLLWWIIRLLPLILLALQYFGAWRVGTSESLSRLDMDSELYGILTASPVIGIGTSNFFYTMFENAFSALDINFFNFNPPACTILLYISYIATIEVIRFFFDFILFLPKFARKLLNKWGI